MASGDARIRRARPEDAAALTRLALRSKQVWGYDPAFMARCRAELTVTAEAITAHPTFVLVEADPPLGFYQLRLTDHVADVLLFFVAPEAIGRGVGRRLWAHLEALAGAQGARRITADADPNAAGFYVLMGAVRCGDSPSASFPDRRLPHFEKRLSGAAADRGAPPPEGGSAAAAPAAGAVRDPEPPAATKGDTRP